MRRAFVVLVVGFTLAACASDEGGGESSSKGGGAGVGGGGGATGGTLGSLDGGGGWVYGGSAGAPSDSGTGASGGSEASAGSGGTGGTAGTGGGTGASGGSGGGGGTVDAGVTATSCKDLLAKQPSTPNGVYPLKPTGSSSSISAYCDMSGGGWTLAFVSNKTAANKAGLPGFYGGTGSGALTDNSSFYAIAGYGSYFHYSGIELRLKWKCGSNVGVASVVGSGVAQLDAGTATWKDTRTAAALQASGGQWHQSFSGFSYSGSTCWSGDVWNQYVYGFSIGNGSGYGQFVGWYAAPSASAWSTAITDNANDNIEGTATGWFR